MKTKKTDEHMSFNNRYQHFVFHQLQVEKLETFLDGKIQDCYEHIEVDPVKFYSALGVKEITKQFQVRVTIQQKFGEHAIYTRKMHCHCENCLNYMWENCKFNYEPEAGWIRQDISIVVNEINNESSAIYKFYANKTNNVWNPENKLILVLVKINNDVGVRKYLVARLNSCPSINSDKTTRTFQFSEGKFKIVLQKGEYCVNVTLLVRKKQNINIFTYTETTLILPLSSVYLEDPGYNDNCYNYIEVKELDNNDIQVRNFRLTDSKLYFIMLMLMRNFS